MRRQPDLSSLQAGFTLIEMAIALAVLGILMLPLAHSLAQLQDRRREATTQAALHAAREALLAYAIQHRGCLPHAADYEGGASNTDAGGNGGSADTGSVRAAVEPAAGQAGQRAGDIPWADLQLNGMGIDGEQLRLQYYVASAFTAPLQTRAANDNPASRNGCAARMRQGVEAWQTATPYRQGDLVASGSRWYVAAGDMAANMPPPAAPWQVFGPIEPWNSGSAYQPRGDVGYEGKAYRALEANTAAVPAFSPLLWREIGLPTGAAPPAWQGHATEGYRLGEVTEYNGQVYRVTASSTSPATPPDLGSGWEKISLLAIYLQTRLGPQVNTSPGNTVCSGTNVAVLIAPGSGRNATLNRSQVRDANHLSCNGGTCSSWATLNDSNVDGRAFSLAADTADASGTQDRVLPISYGDYQAALLKAGLRAQPVGY